MPSLRRDSGRVRPVVGHASHRCHRVLLHRFPVHCVCWGRVCSAQQHSCSEGIDARAQLSDSRGNDPEPRRHLPDPRRTILAVVLSVTSTAWTQLRHDLCFPADQDEPHREDTGGFQEAISDQEASVHVRCSTGL